MAAQARPESRIEYRDFDLLFTRAGEQYEAIVVRSPHGQGRHLFTIDLQLQDLRRFQGPGRTLRHSPDQWESLAHEFGDRLFEAVFSGEVGELYRRCEASVRSGSGKRRYGLRIQLQFGGDTAELARLPWEYLRDSRWQQFLALSPARPVIRSLQLDLPHTRTEARLPLRILVVAPDPLDLPRLEVETEWGDLQESLSNTVVQGNLELHRLWPPTMIELRRTLLSESFDIFHFIGHGTFDEARGKGILFFENEARFSDAVSAEHLGMVLQERSIRLAVLNACEAAAPSVHDRFAGTAQQLLLKGVPAVVGMQFVISDRAAILFASELYYALVQGHPLEAAVVHGRGALYQDHDFEWGTPVLYMQSGSLVLFRPRPAGEAKALIPNPETSAVEPAAPTPPPADERGSRVPRAAWWAAVIVLALLATGAFVLRPWSRRGADADAISRVSIRTVTPQGAAIHGPGVVVLSIEGSAPRTGILDSTGRAAFGNLRLARDDSVTVRVVVAGHDEIRARRAVSDSVLTVSLPPPVPGVRDTSGATVRIGKIGSVAPELLVNGQRYGILDSLAYVRVPAGVVRLQLVRGACRWDTTLIVHSGDTATVGRREPACPL